jgi:hypothetical protein
LKDSSSRSYVDFLKTILRTPHSDELVRKIGKHIRLC